MIETADNAAKHLEDVCRQIEKLLSQNKGKKAKRAERMLTDIKEDLQQFAIKPATTKAI